MVTSTDSHFNVVSQRLDKCVGVGICRPLSSQAMHTEIVRLPAIRHRFIAAYVLINRRKYATHTRVRLVVLSEIHPGEQQQKCGHSKHILLYCREADPLAIDGLASAEMHSVHGQLPLTLDQEGLIAAFQEEIVDPLHNIAEVEIVESLGTNCPKTAGRAHGTGLCLEYSFDVRGQTNSGLGWK
jgi:hypothetical protein